MPIRRIEDYRRAPPVASDKPDETPRGPRPEGPSCRRKRLAGHVTRSGFEVRGSDRCRRPVREGADADAPSSDHRCDRWPRCTRRSVARSSPIVCSIVADMEIPYQARCSSHRVFFRNSSSESNRSAGNEYDSRQRARAPSSLRKTVRRLSAHEGSGEKKSTMLRVAGRPDPPSAAACPPPHRAPFATRPSDVPQGRSLSPTETKSRKPTDSSAVQVETRHQSSEPYRCPPPADIETGVAGRFSPSAGIIILRLWRHRGCRTLSASDGGRSARRHDHVATYPAAGFRPQGTSARNARRFRSDRSL